MDAGVARNEGRRAGKDEGCDWSKISVGELKEIVGLATTCANDILSPGQT